MFLEILLSAAIEAGLGLLAEAGFGDELLELKERLGKKEARQRQEAFQTAWEKAVPTAGNNPEVLPLFGHRPFQEEVAKALLDPLGGFDVQTASREWTEKLPRHALALNRFFNALESALMADDTWGPILQRYQDLRFRQDVQIALKEKHLPETDRLVVQVLSSNFQADVRGQGVNVQGTGNIVVGANGLLVMGDYAPVVQLTLQQFIGGASPGHDRSNDARKRYLTQLRNFCRSLPLAALGGEETAEDDVTLDSVYTDLDTTLKVKPELLETIRQGQAVDWKKLSEKETVSETGSSATSENKPVPLPLVDAACGTPRTVLLGDPGAGKSTFVRMLLAWQAGALLGECDPPAGSNQNLLPVLITLRDLAPRLAALEVEKAPAERQRQALLQAVFEQVESDLKNFQSEAFAAELCDSLVDGNVLLVLDGLDEVPQKVRRMVRLTVAGMLSQWKPVRLLVTCRIRSYTGEAVLSLQSFTIAPFDEQKIRNFAAAWYRSQQKLGRLTVQQAETRTADLASASTSSSLLEIASNPMMLTSMAILHQKEIGLPNQRVRLYTLIVDVLMRRWQKHKTGDDALAAFFKDELRLRATLERLAYEAHRTRPRQSDLADLPRGEALMILEKQDYLGGFALAEEFLDYVDQRAGLLVGRGGEEGRPSSYTFPHRTIQEYLAGCYLAGQRYLARAFYQHAAEDDRWDVAVVSGMEELYFNRINKSALLDLAYDLCPPDDPRTAADWRARLWSGQVAQLLGLEAIQGDNEHPGGGQNFIQRLIPGLVELLGSPLLPLERAEAGRTLALLGDPRREVMETGRMQFCRIPAGQFLMGSDKKKDPQADNDESPQHSLELPEYWIGRYLVSNAQFTAFVGAGGYAQVRYWKEAKKAGYWQEDGFKGIFDNEPRRAPQENGSPFNLPNHPVVGVSWYEALAFTRWLNENLAELCPGWSVFGDEGDLAGQALRRGLQEGRLHVKLPSEAEWEKAARGEDGRIFPWVGKFDSNRANMIESRIGTTTALGCFPGGASPYGLFDMSGNVWEWTRSLDGKYPYPGEGPERAAREDLLAGEDTPRVLRGGSFSGFGGWARCAYRNWYNPGNIYWVVGFRLVVSLF